MSTSTRQEFSGDVEGNIEVCPTEEEPDPVPQQLKEIISLMGSINRRLEDCAVEWQSAVSRKQWRILDAKPVSQKSWEQSLLARTYFTDKSLDEAFQGLLLQDRSFTEQLNNFVALLRGEKTSETTASVCDAQNQCPDVQAMDCCQDQTNFPMIAPLDLTLLEDRATQKTRKSKRLAAGNAVTNVSPNLSSVQESFADLIKAKINLDTKFLGFEAILNGAATPIKEPSCLCQICSNVLGNTMHKGTVMKNISTVRQKVQRVTKPKNKRLTKTSRTRTRRKPTKNNQTVSLVHIGDQPAIGSARSYKASIAQ